jgi:vacuolar iron transporter family protein
MPMTPHVEKHFRSSEIVRDVVIGMSDGLTVPFALAAGLAGATDAARIILTAGFAEIAAGSIAMGLGGYLAARSEAEHYANEERREYREVAEVPKREREEVAEIFREYGLTDEQIAPILDAMEARPRAWVDFMMRFELGLEKPDPRRGMTSALVIASSYVVGGLIPLWPYMVFRENQVALIVSASVTLLALFIFGYVKGRFTGIRPIRSALQTTMIGGLAAGAAYTIASWLS